jgi:hypothetical protein
MRTAACVWRINAELVLALDERLGPPVDSYVNGSQTWLTGDEDAGATFEWRLHPVASYRRPTGVSHYDLWEQVITQLVRGTNAAELRLGGANRPLASLWDGLECFPAYGEEVEPAPLATVAGALLGHAPDAVGLVDHDRVGAEWERSHGTVSIVELLITELRG